MDNTEALLASSLRVEALLRALPGRLAAVLAAQGRSKVTPADRAVLDVLLEPLLAAVGEAHFTLKDLDEQALQYPELQTALTRVDGIMGKRSRNKALGRLLVRVSGQDVGGAVLWKRAEERAGSIWQIQRL